MLQDLIKAAEESIKFRGHKLAKWQIYHGEGKSLANYECPVCGKGAQCNTRPLPNDIDIGGEAVALGCFDKEN